MTQPLSVMELREVMQELTPSQRTKLVRLSIMVGRNAGYCDEMVRLLNMIGFTIPTVPRTNAEIDAYNDPEDF